MRRTTKLASTVLLAAPAALLAPAVGAAAPAGHAPAVVEHDVVSAPVYFESDICGDRPVVETVTTKTEVERFTERANGGFHYLYVAVFSYTADFVDPSVPDTTWRGNEVINANLSPGGTFTFTESLRASDSEIRIHFSLHLTAVDGVPQVEHVINDVTGCP